VASVLQDGRSREAAMIQTQTATNVADLQTSREADPPRGQPEGQSYERSFAVHRSALFGYLLSLCRDPDRAEDLLQLTFEKFLCAREPIAGERLAPWLFVVARNAFYDDQRARRSRPKLLAFRDAASDPEPVDTEATVEARVLLRELLGQLPSRQRDALLLTKAWGYSGAEAANALGTCPATVKVWVHRGCLRLRASLQSAQQ
jgi:RNA polymerase sigma-70 factor (ECF subfamily)